MDEQQVQNIKSLFLQAKSLIYISENTGLSQDQIFEVLMEASLDEQFFQQYLESLQNIITNTDRSDPAQVSEVLSIVLQGPFLYNQQRNEQFYQQLMQELTPLLNSYDWSNEEINKNITKLQQGDNDLQMIQQPQDQPNSENLSRNVEDNVVFEENLQNMDIDQVEEAKDVQTEENYQEDDYQTAKSIQSDQRMISDETYYEIIKTSWQYTDTLYSDLQNQISKAYQLLELRESILNGKILSMSIKNKQLSNSFSELLEKATRYRESSEQKFANFKEQLEKLNKKRQKSRGRYKQDIDKMREVIRQKTNDVQQSHQAEMEEAQKKISELQAEIVKVKREKELLARQCNEEKNLLMEQADSERQRYELEIQQLKELRRPLTRKKQVGN